MNTMLLANALFTLHQGKSGGRGLSPRLWGKARGQMLAPDGLDNAFFLGDDFGLFQGFTNAISGTTALPSTTIPSVDGYRVYVDSATTASGISRLADVSGGVARFAPGATDNHLAIMASGDIGTLSNVAADAKTTIFEARIRLATQITSGSTFVGLASPGAVADGGLIADAGGLMANQGGIGFRTQEDDPDGIDFVYQAVSQTPVVVANIAKQLTAADVWVKVGFIYDPSESASKRIVAYVDNVEVSTPVTATNIAAATFPNADFFGFFAAAMTQATTQRLLDIDWWMLYQQG